MQPILEVRNLRKWFSGQKAVDGVSFSIPRGSIFGLLGPNGAGKTTLLRMVTGIFYPDEGEILFDGKPFDPEADAVRIGYMPEERGLYKKMKIGEQALYLAMLKGLSRQDAMTRIKEWFVKFGMESWWHKKVEDLSKGMSQKLQFVTTVLHEPDLIILDEPFSGLDPVNANLIRDEIFRLSAEGRTIIFSTHRMEQVEEICREIILVNQGRKILDGPVRKIREDFKEGLFRIGFGDRVLPEHLAIHLFRVVSGGDTELVVRKSEDATTNDILSYFIHKGLSIRSFNEILPTLNEIFIRQVGDTPVSRAFGDGTTAAPSNLTQA